MGQRIRVRTVITALNITFMGVGRMKRISVMTILVPGILLISAGCSNAVATVTDPQTELTGTTSFSEEILSEETEQTKEPSGIPDEDIVPVFKLDEVLHTEETGDIHYNLYVPDDYDSENKYALHIALPGWEGLYFQGVGEDLRWEYMPFESVKYNKDTIVASLQLNDWEMTSAQQTVILTEHLMEEFSIDKKRVYITGYSGGGETLSLVMEIRPEIYSAALFMSSKWDGDPARLVEAKTPLYIFTSEHDSYYGSEPAVSAWQLIRDQYLSAGYTEEEIKSILVLDVREDAWFDKAAEIYSSESGDGMDYHGAGLFVALDENVMRWVFEKSKDT